MSQTATENDSEFVNTATVLVLAWIAVFLLASLGLITFGETLMQLFA